MKLSKTDLSRNNTRKTTQAKLLKLYSFVMSIPSVLVFCTPGNYSCLPFRVPVYKDIFISQLWETGEPEAGQNQSRAISHTFQVTWK